MRQLRAFLPPVLLLCGLGAAIAQGWVDPPAQLPPPPPAPPAQAAPAPPAPPPAEPAAPSVRAPRPEASAPRVVAPPAEVRRTPAEAPRPRAVVRAPEPELEPEPAPRLRAERRTPSPSFNCRYAGTSVERAICADPDLATKDRIMASLYEKVGGSRHGPVDPTQWRWLAARDACGRRAGASLNACIRHHYDARIAELSGWRR